MPPKSPHPALALPLLLLPMLMAACASASLPPPQVRAPLIPPLPAQARQTDLPTHSQRAAATIETWLQPPTAPSSPARPASAPTAR